MKNEADVREWLRFSDMQIIEDFTKKQLDL